MATAAVAAFAFGGTGLAGDTAAHQSRASVTHTFQLTDNPGNWFDTGTSIAGTRSLVVARPGDTIRFNVGAETNTVHTASSLLYPTGAAHMPFDQPQAYGGVEEVRVTTPGLYVFLCKLHPFMLGAVIVDDPATQGLDLGKTITLVSGATVPTASDLAFRLLRSFFNITNTQNYQVHTETGSMWDPEYPAVPVLAHDKNGNPVLISDLNAAFQSYFHEPIAQPAAIPPSGKGIGEVWINTEYEQTAAKTKPGTATAVRTSDWAVTRKVALPSVNMNNPHNMWTDRSQSVIYATQWFDDKLTVFDRKTGGLLRNVTVGEAPAHVMTRVDTDQVHVSINGEGSMVELSPFATHIDRTIQVQESGNPAQPHAHWMSHDGHTMVTPNSNTDDSTVVNVAPGTIEPKVATGYAPDRERHDAGREQVLRLELPLEHDQRDRPDHAAAHADQEHRPARQLRPDLRRGQRRLWRPAGPDAGEPERQVGLHGEHADQHDHDHRHGHGHAREEPSVRRRLSRRQLRCQAGRRLLRLRLEQVRQRDARGRSRSNDDGSAADAAVVGRVLLNAAKGTKADDVVTGNAGMGGQGVLPIPLVYNGWVQNVPNTAEFKGLTCEQRHPIGGGDC